MSDPVNDANEEYDVVATSAPVDHRTQILKLDETFGVFNRLGDIDGSGGSHMGLYRGDTRFLSQLRLRIEGARPLLLDSSVSQDNTTFRVDLMNADITEGERLKVPHGAIHLLRSKVMGPASCIERACFHNYSLEPVDIGFTVDFDADFADIFEVRGTPRSRRGDFEPPRIDAHELVFGYQGADGRHRHTHVHFEREPEWVGRQVLYPLHLEPHAETTFAWTVSCEIDAAADEHQMPGPGYEHAIAEAVAEACESMAQQLRIETSNDLFNDWINRSSADIRMLTSFTPCGPYPYAGVPWFSTPFGRDGIITALECLWMNPNLARGVLTYLAATQAFRVNPERDEQPGKIIHEARDGEMASLGEVPFDRYYGSADSTPLFVLLAGAYYERTGDLEFAREIWPNVERALRWIETYGDADSDGFYEYHRLSPTGLLNQGWKDSADSVFHADGRLAEGPIALCEVQGYVFAAKQAAAKMARSLGEAARADRLESQAEELRERFERAFWCEELSTYALALDGAKQPCRVATSNAGHCLFTGIASEEHAALVARTLFGEDSYSGWGIRSVSAKELRYNPLSYHNGSVWPHDNAIIAAGLSRYGLNRLAANVMQGLFDTSVFFDAHRLPELFCGFPRQPDEPPTHWPVACSPQAWAAGSVFLCLQACLGLHLTSAETTVSFSDPVLPPFLDWVEIRGLRVGEGSVDLVLTRRLDQAVVGIGPRTGRVRVITVK
ncbi:MAG: glycogen debranching N-terminal domain-containing protein [Coriobacteriia bacterium]